MTLMAGLTGAFGLLSSFLLLHQGIQSMTLRFPLALVCAYLMFLFLIWLWLRTNARDYLDSPNLSSASSNTSDGSACAPETSGADFGVSDSASAVAEADGLAIPLMALVLAVGMAFASLYVIYIAPALLEEVLVDGSFSYALYRYVRADDPEHWLATAVRRTALPFLATGIFLMVMGAALSAYAPGAHTLGEAIRGTQNAGR